jgi:hypothetical protein
MDDGRFADSCRARDVNLPGQAHTVLQLDAGTNYTIRSDLDAGPNARTVGDARRCINRHLLLDPTTVLLWRLSTLRVMRKTGRPPSELTLGF